MLEPAGEKERRPRDRRQSPAVLWVVAITPLVLGLGLLVAERAPGVAWPLVICGGAFISILVGQPTGDRRRQ